MTLKAWLIIAGIFAILGGDVYWYWKGENSQAVRDKVETLEREKQGLIEQHNESMRQLNAMNQLQQRDTDRAAKAEAELAKLNDPITGVFSDIPKSDKPIFDSNAIKRLQRTR